MTSHAAPANGRQRTRSLKRDDPSNPRGATPLFRPSSLKDFNVYAKNLSQLTGLALQASQEQLARVYGYSGLHELQQELAKPGTPGPFEDVSPVPPYEQAQDKGAAAEELEVDDDFSGLDLIAQMRDAHDAHVRAMWTRDQELELAAQRKKHERLQQLVRRLECLNAQAGSVPSDRASAIVELGLFSSPAQHRACAKRLGLTGNDSPAGSDWPAGMWGLLSRIYRAPYGIAMSQLIERSASHREDVGQAFGTWHPLRMLQTAAGVAAPSVYLAMAPKPPARLMALGPFWEDADDVTWCSWTLDRNAYDDNYADVWTQWVVSYATGEEPPVRTPKRKRVPTQPAAASPDEAQALQEVTNFRLAPSAEIASKNRYLRLVPNVFELAQHWRHIQLYELANEAVETQAAGSHNVVLYQQRHLALGPEGEPAAVGCFISLDQIACEQGPTDPVQLWNAEATFVREPLTPGEEGVVLAVVRSCVLCPSAHGKVSSEDHFFYAADSWDQEFCTLAEIILERYLRSRKFKSLRGFCTRHPGKSFASVTVVLDEPYRGRGLLAPLLGLWLDTLNGHEQLRVDATCETYAPQPVARRIKQLAAQAAKSFQPPGVLLFPIGVHPDNPTSQAQERKVRLTRHMQGLRGKLAADIAIFDPNDDFDSMQMN